MIYEHRVYTMEMRKRELMIWAIKGFLAVVEKKFGVKGLGPFRPVIGNSNELSYYMIYESMAHREQTWEAFSSDEDMGKWQKEFTERIEEAGGLGLSTPISPGVLNSVQATGYSVSGCSEGLKTEDPEPLAGPGGISAL